MKNSIFAQLNTTTEMINLDLYILTNFGYILIFGILTIAILMLHMPKKENDMLREQRRRRRDLLELKSAEMADTAPKKEEYSAPRTPKEKLENFWYHNKWAAVALVAVLLVSFLSFLQRFC